MKSIKALFVGAILAVPSFAMAEGGADRALAQMAQKPPIEASQVAQKTKADAEVVDGKTKSGTHSNC